MLREFILQEKIGEKEHDTIENYVDKQNKQRGINHNSQKQQQQTNS